ncbi:NADH-quinone oxidoreductase subunit NuoF [Calderihabitans maritimus]
MGTCGIAAGAKKVWEAISQEIRRQNLDVEVRQTGCLGMCHREVLVEVRIPGQPKVIYGNISPESVKRIVQEHLVEGRIVKDLVVGMEAEKGTLLEGMPLLEENPFWSKQLRLVTRNCGIIDPDSIDDYLKAGGYQSLRRVLAEYTPEEVIAEVKNSGLRGRGGGGFPTGIKWESTRNAVGDRKYVICNADEGDPGAFMDRSILEGDPHAVIEGMIIAAYAVGARDGYIYIRAEYPLAVHRLMRAIDQARERNFLGDNILGSGFNFHLYIKQGAGAFVCGEETALIASIEGNRGMPRPRPPFPATKGLWDRPTNINNVETYANIPVIFRIGASEFASIGTEQSKGTKVFAVTGKVKKTGLVEVPMGITLREIIFDICGGIKDDKKFKAVQIGGPSGGCLPEQHLDLPVDYDSLISAGAMMGSGGLVVLDENTCMVELARYFLQFTRNESCGKCTPCREGLKRLLEILNRIVNGKGEKGDLDRLITLGSVIINTSLCGLGQSAPNPVLSTIRYFRSEYEMHIEKKFCPAGVCKDLTTYRIIEEKCKACSICLKHCPAGAITGEKRTPHRIDPEKCARCGICLEKCPFEAIVRA